MTVNEVTNSMVEYLNDEPDCGYKQKHIDKCAKILIDYEKDLGKLKTNANDSDIMKLVQKVVIALNKLNEATDYCLIETDQREDLYEFIQEKAVSAGLTDTDGDITEEWREW